MAVPSPPTAERADVRRMRSLESYVERLREWEARQGASSDQGARIHIGTRTLALDPWERQHVREFLGGKAAPGGIAELVTQGIALLVKATVDTERVRGDKVKELDALYTLQSELMLDSAIARALLGETQAAIERCVMSGEVDGAKRLSQFRHKIHRVAADVKEVVSQSEPAVAEVAVVVEPQEAGPKPPVAAPPTPSARRPVVPLEEGAAPAPRRRRRPPRPAPQRESRTAAPRRSGSWRTTVVLAIVCGLTLVAGGLSRDAGPAAPVRRDPAVVAVAALSAPAIGAVVARPPSLFVEVHEDEWERMSVEARWELARQVSSRIAPLGYDGALFRTGAGRPVADWLELRGVSILDAREGSDAGGGTRD